MAALNGFDVQGRKLRVEYKKVLQAGEKERIEKEKALRRMRSMQMEKDRAAQQHQQSPGNNDWDDYGNLLPSQNQQYGNNGMGVGLGLPLGGGGYGISANGNLMQSPARSYSSGGGAMGGMSPTQSHSQPSPNLGNIPPVPQIPQQYYQQMPSRQASQQQTPMLHVTTPPPMESPLDQYNQNHGLRSFSPPSMTSTSPPPVSSLIQRHQEQQQQQQQNLFESTVSPPSKNYTELDMNDASTLEIYSRILLFKDDRMRDELAFSRSLTAMERRVVHMVAKKLGLYHHSVGEGNERYAVVMRYPPDNSRVSLPLPFSMPRCRRSLMTILRKFTASPYSSTLRYALASSVSVSFRVHEWPFWRFPVSLNLVLSCSSS